MITFWVTYQPLVWKTDRDPLKNCFASVQHVCRSHVPVLILTRTTPVCTQNVTEYTVKHSRSAQRYIGQIRSYPEGRTVRSGHTQWVSVRSGHTRGIGENDTHTKDTTTLFYFRRSGNHFSRSTES